MTKKPPFQPALSNMLMPKDANIHGTIFGGVVLSLIDQAGFVEARRHGMHRWLTASIDRVDFKRPIRIGDIAHLHTRTLSTGNSSVLVEIRVDAERYDSGKIEEVTRAQSTMVSVGPNMKPIPFSSSPSMGAIWGG